MRGSAALALALALLGTLPAARAGAEAQTAAAWAPMLEAAARFVNGDLDGAAVALRRARPTGRRVQAETGMVLVALERGDPAAADAALADALAAGGDDPELHYYAAVLELKRDRPQAALAALERAQSLGGDRPPFLVARAVALKALGRGAEAAAALAGAARVDPDLTDPRLFPDSGRGAVHAMERALADYPNQLRLRVTVAQLYLAARLWREAEAAAQVVLRERAGEPDALIVLGRARLGWGDREGALEALDRAVAAAPDLAAVRGARAEAYLALGRGADAEAELTLAVEADGRDALSMSRLATRLWERGELQKAEELWGYVLRRDPNAAAAHAGMAQAHERAKRPAEAEAAYRAAVASEPSNPRYYEALALFLERHGRARDAAPFKARARTVAAAARALEARRARAGAYLAALARAAGRARAGDAAGVQAALTGVRGPQAPLAFVRAHLAARAGQSPLGPATAALGGLPGPRTFAAGSATVLQQTAALGRGERVRVTLFLPGVNPELLR